jgi:hypothetical protein
MKIKITEFAKRHFDKNFGGTKILDRTVEEFEIVINNEISFRTDVFKKPNVKILDGYADFCKLAVLGNFTDARVGSLPITLENYQYLRSGYSARRDSELPVFSRWLELPIGKPRAEYLIIVLYNKEQLDKEGHENPIHINDSGKLETYTEFDADWGVVAILGQSHDKEEPMKPETMLRNALGTSEGGSGVPLDRAKYLESVDFWSVNATVK